MEIIAKVNEFDVDMVELYDKNKEFMWGAVHIDNFLGTVIYTRLSKHEELTLGLEISGGERWR